MTAPIVLDLWRLVECVGANGAGGFLERLSQDWRQEFPGVQGCSGCSLERIRRWLGFWSQARPKLGNSLSPNFDSPHLVRNLSLCLQLGSVAGLLCDDGPRWHKLFKLLRYHVADVLEFERRGAQHWTAILADNERVPNIVNLPPVETPLPGDADAGSASSFLTGKEALEATGRPAFWLTDARTRTAGRISAQSVFNPKPLTTAERLDGEVYGATGYPRPMPHAQTCTNDTRLPSGSCVSQTWTKP